jgi:hypothetical protein
MAKSLVERLNSWTHDPMAAASDLMEEAALISTLVTLASKWQQQADSEMVTASEETRAAVRACADTLRMLCEVRLEDYRTQRRTAAARSTR